MGELVSRREATLKQRLQYLELGLRTDAALEEAMRLLSLNGRAAGTPNRSRLKESLREVRDAWRGIRSDLFAYVAGDLRVQLPTANVARTVRERSDLLVSLTPEVPPAVILTLVHDLVDQWNETRPHPPAPATVAPTPVNGKPGAEARGSI
jgi:hypothetical protein